MEYNVKILVLILIGLIIKITINNKIGDLKMELENRFKPAMVTTELAIGIGLAVVALFIAIGLFYQPLSDIFVNTNFNNMFKDNGDKTGYASFNRDYSKSQINVQITGEQGLEMLRRKANNKAIDIIEEDFSNSNSNGASIAYLTTAVKIISGEPHICKYMKKDSDRHCDEIGGYDYKITMNGSALEINRVSDGKKVTLSFGSIISSILDTVVVPTDDNGYPAFAPTTTENTKKKYDLILYISKGLKDYIRKDALLINVASTFDSHNIAQGATVEALMADTKAFTKNITESAEKAYVICNPDSWRNKDTGNIYNGNKGNSGCLGYYQIEESDITALEAWQKEVNNAIIDNASSKLEIADVMNIIQKSIENNKVTTLIKNDNANSEANGISTCEAFTNGLTNINSKYGNSINIPACVPTGAKHEALANLLDIADTVYDTISDVTEKAVEKVGSFFKHLFD